MANQTFGVSSNLSGNTALDDLASLAPTGESEPEIPKLVNQLGKPDYAEKIAAE